MSYDEIPVEILDRQVKKLTNKEWEAEEDMKNRYPYLLPTNQA